MKTNRREFLKMTATGAVTIALPAYAQEAKKEEKPKQQVAQTAIPRWRGFNLLDMFTMQSRGDWQEDDFRWIRDFGFDFVRLPACYRLWIQDGDDYKINEEMLAKLDRAVEFGNKYGLHVDINFHRGPGYSVNREFTEPFNLWKDQKALDAFCFHWQMLAKRYKGISKDKLSFNLINEPPNESERMSRADHERVVRAAVAAIRKESPNRIVIAEGLTGLTTRCRNWPTSVSPRAAGHISRCL